MSSRRRGSAILVVAIVMTAVSLVAASLLRLGVHETGMNYRRIADMEALNAVESAVEVASAYLAGRFNTETSIPSGDVSFSMSSKEKEQILASMKYVTDIEVSGIRNEVKGKRIFIDPNDPENVLDLNKGKLINVSEWMITAEATVDYKGQERKIYAAQTFQVREAPLFTHAIFYNMDLEFHPGPEMIISGPVHANGDIWIAAKGALYFKDIVSATGGIKAGMMQADYQLDWSSMGGENTQNPGKVWFNTGKDEGGEKTKKIDGTTYHFDNIDAENGVAYNKAGRYVDARASLDTLKDQGYTKFEDYLANNFSGMVLSGKDSAPALRPMDMPPYVPDMTDDGIDQQENHGYAMIEPPLGASDPSDPTVVNPFNKGALEKDKFSFKAGLTFEVQYSESGPPAANAVQLIRRGGSRSGGDLTPYYVIPKKIKRSNPHDFDSAVMATKKVLNEEGEEVEVAEVQYEPVRIAPEVLDTFMTLREYREDSGKKPIDGIFDRRRGKAHDLVAFDMERFNRAFFDPLQDEDGDKVPDLKEEAGVDPTETFKYAGVETYVPSYDYNSVVYFEFPTVTPDPNRTDGVVKAQDTFRTMDYQYVNQGGGGKKDLNDAPVGLALSLENTKEVPDPNHGIPGRSEGFTLATNGMLYVKGHFNADGDKDTGSSTEGDGAADTVAALVADAITILSPSYSYTKSKDKPGASSFTEFNGAIITGLMPTNYKGQDGYGSGGNHNLPRFLENWGGDTFRYRGSMVALFESENAVEPWSTKYYSPPKRDWGFFNRFGQGAQPPGTPVLRTYHKLDFRYLTENEYALLTEKEEEEGT